MNLDDAYWKRLLRRISTEKRPERVDLAGSDSDNAEPCRASRPANGACLYQVELEKLLGEPTIAPAWLREAYDSFSDRIADPAFPCFFADVAQQQQRLRFAFADAIRRPREIEFIAAAIEAYLADINKLPTANALMSSLVVFIRPIEGLSVDEYDQHAWAIMNALRDRDKHSWPKSVPKDPNNALFSFSFGGEPIFINVSTPAHVRRRSRNLGSAMVLAVQLSRNFRLVPDKVRKQIRKKIARYDDVEVSPYLGTYGEPGTLEWRQYVLSDDNDESPATCPFHARV